MFSDVRSSFVARSSFELTLEGGYALAGLKNGSDYSDSLVCCTSLESPGCSLCASVSPFLRGGVALQRAMEIAQVITFVEMLGSSLISVISVSII